MEAPYGLNRNQELYADRIEGFSLSSINAVLKIIGTKIESILIACHKIRFSAGPSLPGVAVVIV